MHIWSFVAVLHDLYQRIHYLWQVKSRHPACEVWTTLKYNAPGSFRARMLLGSFTHEHCRLTNPTTTGVYTQKQCQVPGTYGLTQGRGPVWLTIYHRVLFKGVTVRRNNDGGWCRKACDGFISTAGRLACGRCQSIRALSSTGVTLREFTDKTRKQHCELNYGK